MECTSWIRSRFNQGHVPLPSTRGGWPHRTAFRQQLHSYQIRTMLLFASSNPCAMMCFLAKWYKSICIYNRHHKVRDFPHDLHFVGLLMWFSADEVYPLSAILPQYWDIGRCYLNNTGPVKSSLRTSINSRPKPSNSWWQNTGTPVHVVVDVPYVFDSFRISHA